VLDYITVNLDIQQGFLKNNRIWDKIDFNEFVPRKGFIMEQKNIAAASEISAILARAASHKDSCGGKIPVCMGYVRKKLIAVPVISDTLDYSENKKISGYVEISADLERYPAGSTVNVTLCCSEEQLKNTLLFIGSHDPLVDEISKILTQRNSSYILSSAHVGSMGGIQAIRRGEAHLAGIHLLNEKDGTYNESFVKKYFPNDDVTLIECVGRTQGIMVSKKNPKNIADISSLCSQEIRYINRQKGSGTRILFDYLCKKEGIAADSINGYDREEFTHNDVAKLIATGWADAGMGVHAAAKLYDLDFIPIYNEQYDLLIPNEMLKHPGIQEIIDILKSEEFAEKSAMLGGYTLNNPGLPR